MVSEDKQIFKCFGCGEGGDIFSFVMEMEGIEFREALHLLARRAGIEINPIDNQLRSEQKALYDICERATNFFIKQFFIIKFF